MPAGASAGETNTSSGRPSMVRPSACEACTTTTRVRGSAQAASIQAASERRWVARSTAERESASRPSGPASDPSSSAGTLIGPG